MVHWEQVDGSNFKAALGTESLQKMDIVINRSAPMAARVARDRAAAGGAAAVRAQVLQKSAADRGGCPPDQAAPPLPLGMEPL
ncbi:g10762 [Coccomyxa elongata]